MPYYEILIKKYIKLQVWRFGFLFVDIPRTSSSSIRTELSKRYGNLYRKRNIIDKKYSTPHQLLRDHQTAIQMRQIVGGKLWSKIFTFTMTRNPWDRVLSMFHYRKRISRIPANTDFKTYVYALNQPKDDNNKLFNSNEPVHYYDMSRYILDENGKIIVNYVGKYENRREDLQYIADRIGINELGILHIQKASPGQKHYSLFYDDELQEIVGSMYYRDIQLFDYSFEDKK